MLYRPGVSHHSVLHVMLLHTDIIPSCFIHSDAPSLHCVIVFSYAFLPIMLTFLSSLLSYHDSSSIMRPPFPVFLNPLLLPCTIAFYQPPALPDLSQHPSSGHLALPIPSFSPLSHCVLLPHSTLPLYHASRLRHALCPREAGAIARHARVLGVHCITRPASRQHERDFATRRKSNE